ncbi:MAG: SpvB/TcaC N-terminal domain-containing protein, partial [Flavisolibacter sp.]
EWLPEFVFDDKGTCANYIYKAEDAIGFDPSQLHNRNRMVNGIITYTNIYLEKVLYGNQTPYKTFGQDFPSENDYLFSCVFDYGEYNVNSPYEKVKEWDFRTDVFSNYKAGFEIRTTRLCRRILLFHHFNGTNEYSGLVRSMDFEFDTQSEKDFTFLMSITGCGYIKRTDGSYSIKKLPPLEFQYQKHSWNKEVKNISTGEVMYAASAFGGGGSYQFTDLYNEGLNGILTEQAKAWYYHHNLGDGAFTPPTLVSPKPSFIDLSVQLELADLDADGGKQVVSYGRDNGGYFELNDENEWMQFKNFNNLPNINFADANTRMIDLNGDGKPEILISEDQVFTWYPSEGRGGFSPAEKTIKTTDEEAGPHMVFANESQTIFLADMSGDGMTDIVRIRNGEICYWPNLGYGKFGTRVAMDHAPVFDHPDSFNAAYLRLADIDGSGTSDIIYLGRNKFSCWLNLSGNAFSTTAIEIDAFPEIHDQTNITITDILGNGVSCIVCSDNLVKNNSASIRYIDLMNSKKPHLLIGYKNNLGKEVSMEYRPSTDFYLEDKLAGKTWVTKLHFPVHCISKIETHDSITGHRFISAYKYHHGYYDHAEKEFRGFGMVEQTDTEHFEHWIKGNASNIVNAELHQEPVISKTWAHTGAFLDREKILNQFSEEYWFEEMKRMGFEVTHNEVALPDARIICAPGIPETIIEQMSAEVWQQALRSCKGMGLRSEIFAHDAPSSGATDDEIKKQLTPYSVSTHNCVIELIQPKGKNKFAVFISSESESITYTYDRNQDDPRISHTLNIKFDEYGKVLESANVVYPRFVTDPELPVETQEAQNKTAIIYNENRFTNDVIDEEIYQLRLPSEIKTFELKGVNKEALLYSVSDFFNILNIAEEISYNEIDSSPTPGISHKRLIEHVRTNYYREDLSGPLPLHQLESLAITYESSYLAYTPEMIEDIYGAKVNDALLQEAKFIRSEADTNWWIRSGTTQFIEGAETIIEATARFYVPVSFTDPFGAKTSIKYYGNYFLFIEETEDALGNKSKVDQFNFRSLAPKRMRDINNNLTESISDELGMVKAMAIMGKGNEADDL